MNRRRGVVVVALTLIAALAPALAPAGARAAEVSSAKLRTLAASARDGDPAALVALRTVTAIDGRPADLAQLLGHASPAQVRARLAALATAGAGAAAGVGGSGSSISAAARATAASILSQPRYGQATGGDPAASVLSWLGRQITALQHDSPGGPLAFWALAALLVLAIAAWGTRRMLRRLAPNPGPRSGEAEGRGEDPSVLTREAQEAEAQGAFGDAVRLRFRAGLLTLSDRRAIRYRASLLTADVSRQLRSPQFDSLATEFERIAYGGAPASQADSDAAREGWKSVLSEAGGRR